MTFHLKNKRKKGKRSFIGKNIANIFFFKYKLWGPIDSRGTIHLERVGPMAQYPVRG